MIWPLLLLIGLPSARLTPEAAAEFDRYVAQAEARMSLDPIRDGRIRAIEDARHVNAPGAMIQDWVGSTFLPGATLAQVEKALQDYPNYKNYYAPKVIESKLIAHSGDDYDAFLRLYEHHVVTVVLNTAYHVSFRMPDAQHLTVASHSTRIAEVKDPDRSYDVESPVGKDSGFLWRLNSYWHFQAADGGVYAQCEAISLSRDVPLALGWILKGFLEGFPKESMLNTLRGTRAAVESMKGSAASGY